MLPNWDCNLESCPQFQCFTAGEGEMHPFPKNNKTPTTAIFQKQIILPSLWSTTLLWWFFLTAKNWRTTWAAAFICSVAPVKKIYGVPPPWFNLVSQVLALFTAMIDWSRFPIFDINMFINMMHLKTYLVFGVPPSRFDLVLQVKPTFPQTLLDATSSFHQSK